MTTIRAIEFLVLINTKMQGVFFINSISPKKRHRVRLIFSTFLNQHTFNIYLTFPNGISGKIVTGTVIGTEHVLPCIFCQVPSTLSLEKGNQT